MAPKPKKTEKYPNLKDKPSINERTGKPFKSTSEMTRKLMNRAYDLRTIEKINATPAEKRKRARQVLDSSRTAARAKGIANREDKAKTTKAAAKKASYSPRGVVSTYQKDALKAQGAKSKKASDARIAAAKKPAPKKK